MDAKITEKIEKAFCGSRNCDDHNCPFTPKYNNGNYVCLVANNPSENYGVRVDAIQKWLACNEIDTVTECMLVKAGVYDEFVNVGIAWL